MHIALDNFSKSVTLRNRTNNMCKLQIKLQSQSHEVCTMKLISGLICTLLLCYAIAAPNFTKKQNFESIASWKQINSCSDFSKYFSGVCKNGLTAGSCSKDHSFYFNHLNKKCESVGPNHSCGYFNIQSKGLTHSDMNNVVTQDEVESKMLLAK